MKYSPKSNQTEKTLIFMLSAVYFVSYLSRLNYSAVMVEMIGTGLLSKETGGVIGTALFITYGVGQIISGVLGDRLHPQFVIAAGLILSGICNFSMAFCRAVWLFSVIWGINGFAQALLWPPIVRLLSTRLDSTRYERGCFWVTSGGQLSNVVVYLLVPLLISISDWRSVFFIAAGTAILMAFGWIVYARTLPPREAEEAKTDAAEPERPPSLFRITLLSGLLFILIAIAMQGLLRDGITSWLPTFFGEVFGMESSLSVLISVLLPITGIISVYLAGVLYRKCFKDEIKESLFFFFFAGVLCVALGFVCETQPILSLIFAALITGCMHAVNLMLIGYVPRRYKRCGKIATVSGLTNAFTYVGSATSSFGFALIAGTYGWNRLVWIWGAVCAAGICALAASYRRYRRLISV